MPKTSKIKRKHRAYNKTKNKAKVSKKKQRQTRKKISTSEKVLSGGFAFVLYENDESRILDGPDVGKDETHDASTISYNENSFNNNKYVRESHNCYTYFLNKKNQEAVDKCKRDLGTHNICRRSQPGYYSGHKPLNETDYRCDIMMKRTLDDNKNIYKISKEESKKPCPPGYYKGALVVAPGRDYHYYRQDDDLNGKWSHKPGYKPSTDKDSNGNVIHDPNEAARDYGGTLNYKDFCGYMCVPRNNKKKFMAHKDSKLHYNNRMNKPAGNQSGGAQAAEEQTINRCPFCRAENEPILPFMGQRNAEMIRKRLLRSNNYRMTRQLKSIIRQFVQNYNQNHNALNRDAGIELAEVFTKLAEPTCNICAREFNNTDRLNMQTQICKSNICLDCVQNINTHHHQQTSFEGIMEPPEIPRFNAHGVANDGERHFRRISPIGSMPRSTINRRPNPPISESSRALLEDAIIQFYRAEHHYMNYNGPFNPMVPPYPNRITNILRAVYDVILQRRLRAWNIIARENEIPENNEETRELTDNEIVTLALSMLSDSYLAHEENPRERYY